MSDSANKLPVMTDEQRRENLEKATAVRKERKAKATQLMAQAGIAPNRRVKGLGCRQRDYIIDHLPASKG